MCWGHYDSILFKSRLPFNVGACVAVGFDAASRPGWSSQETEFMLRAVSILWLFNVSLLDCYVVVLLYRRIWLDTSKSQLIVGSGLSHGEVIVKSRRFGRQPSMKSQYKPTFFWLFLQTCQKLLQSQSPFSVCYCLTVKVPYLWCCLLVAQSEETFREYSGWNRMAWVMLTWKESCPGVGYLSCRHRVSHLILDSVVGHWY